MEGVFWKEINNEGSILRAFDSGGDSRRSDLAEAFAHFSLEDSNEEWIVIDIQGVGTRKETECHSEGTEIQVNI